MINKNEHNYMMLGRLVSDLDAHFSYGCKLWGITREGHAREMIKRWEAVKVKPEWFTLEQLQNAVSKLTGKTIEEFKKVAA